MNNSNGMSAHSNLMLVEIIYGNSAKYTQDDVLAAELELSSRSVTELEMRGLRNKVAYIGGINIGSVPRTDSSDSSTSTSTEDIGKEGENLEGTDSILVNVLIGYIALTSLGSLGSLMGLFQGSLKYMLISVITLAINIYGIYGLLNRLKLPVLLLIGLFSYGLMQTISSVFSMVFSGGAAYAIVPLIFVVLGVGVIYFLTKPNMREVFDLDGESIKKSILIGIGMAFVFNFL